MKKIVGLSLLALLVNSEAYSLNRCLTMIDQHVINSQLNLAQCGLSPTDAPFILNYLNSAALDLLARHAEQFDTFFYEDYRDLFDRISQWAQHKNYDMKKLAYLTLDSYYKQVFTK